MPERAIVPAPSLVIPKVAPLTIPLIVKSETVVVSSATIKVMFVPKATGQLIKAPAPVPAIFVTVILPPRVIRPAPEIVETVAPHSRFRALIPLNVNPPFASVAPPLTVIGRVERFLFPFNVIVPVP